MLLALTLCGVVKGKKFTVMLNPEGDTRSAGRVLNDCYERGITLQCAEKLKQYMNSFDNTIGIVLTRIPGEILEPLQKANFANRLDPDLYLSIHFYHESQVQSRVYIYHYLANTFYPTLSKQSTFYHFDDIPLININKTLSIGAVFKSIFEQIDYHQLCSFKGLYGIPFNPLIGIKSPALAIEIGLKKSTDFTYFIEPIARAIQAVKPKESLFDQYELL